MNKKIISSILLIATFALGLFFLVPNVSAYRGDIITQGPNYTEEMHDAMTTAFENIDYATWKELMLEKNSNARILDVINEDNFETFAQAHDAMVNGDIETSQKLRTELGLNNDQGPRDGTGNRLGNNQNRKNMGNYDNSGFGQRNKRR